GYPGGRLWAIPRACGPGLAAPVRQVAFLKALEAGRRQAGAEQVLLPPLRAPPVDWRTVSVLQVADDERAAARGEQHPGHGYGVGVDTARDVADRCAQR